MRARISATLLLAGIAAAGAAPNIPSSELPGRERQRFLETPVDRFTQPESKEPLWQWDCNTGKTKKGKKRSGKKGRNC